MKKLLCIILILFLCLAIGCNDESSENYSVIEQADVVDELQQTIIEQADFINELQQRIYEHQDLQQEYLDLIAMLQTEEDISSETEDHRFWHGLFESEIRESFFQNAETLVKDAVGDFRSTVPFAEKIDLIINRSTVIGFIPNAQVANHIVFLRYWKEDGDIIFEVTGYGVPHFRDEDDNFYRTSLPHIIPAREPAVPRHLTDLETVTLPFYDYIDVLSSTDEVIQGGVLWEETIRLAREYYGMQIRDIWYEGTILYVEMMPIMANSYNTGSGNISHLFNIRKTFEAFPNITEVRFLVLGRRYTIGYNGADINCVPPCPGHGGLWWADGNDDNPPEHTCVW